MQLTDAAWATRPYGEVVELAERDGSLLVVPVGSLEQHGYHLPVATDTLLVDAVAHGAAEATSAPVLVSPPVWTGLSPHHLPFGGTISVERAHLAALLEGIAETALENGFDGLLLLNGHGGNAALIDAVVVSIGADHPAVEVTGLTYFALAAEIAEDVRDSAVGGTGHGGEFETSLMLHLYPELVEMDRAEGTMMEAPYERSRKDIFEGGPLSVYRPFTDFSDSGVIGDPTLATAEKGKRLFEHVCAEHTTLFEEIHAQARDRD